MQTACIDSIQVGRPRPIPGEQPWISGFLKEPITGPLWLGATNLEGDGQADLEHHGGEHKAVCVYSVAHYRYWRKQLHIPDLMGGDFAENFSISGLTESDVCIGDVWAVGSAIVQVSQPRQPCWKLARRWNIKNLAVQVQQTGFTGWYLRVLTEGPVQRGMMIKLVRREWPDWTIEAANQIMHHDKCNHDAAARLAAVTALSPSWQMNLKRRFEMGIQPDESKRLGCQ